MVSRGLSGVMGREVGMKMDYDEGLILNGGELLSFYAMGGMVACTT